MKVVYYTDQIYLHGGLERVLANKLNYISNFSNIDLYVITFQQEQKKPCYSIPETVRLHDITINYNRKLSFLHPYNIKHAFSHYIRLKNKIKEINPDVIVVCNYEYGFYFLPFITKKVIKIKEYHSSRHFNDLVRQENKTIFKKIMYGISDFIESKYDYLVLLTKDELKYYKSKNKIVIPNAITLNNKKTASLKNKKVISAGRIAPVKGFENLISAWRLVAGEYPNWVLEIYGDGEQDYIDTLKTQIDNLNLNQKVLLKGPTQNLEENMLESSMFVMSSLTECFPMVLLEAMSLGVPVVSFDCPNGPKNIIKHKEDGLLIEPENIEKLGKSVINLIKNPEKRKRYGVQAKLNVQRFNEEQIMDSWLKIFGYKQIDNI